MGESRIVCQQRIVQNGGLDVDDHVLLSDEPADEVDEGRNDGGVADLLDHQHRHRGLVPRQTLRRRVLNRPKEQGKNVTYFD